MGIADHVRDLATDVLLSLSAHQAGSHEGHNHSGHNRGTKPAATTTAATGSFCTSAGCRRGWKVAFAAVLFLEGLLFGYVALLLRRYACMTAKTFRRLLHYINAGGGGVFLATGLLHVLPESVEIFAEKGAGHHEHAIEFPIPYAIALGTFFAFLLFDRILFPGGHTHAGRRKSVPFESLEDEDEISDEHRMGSRGYEEFDAVVVEEEQDPELEGQNENNESGSTSYFSMHGSRGINGFKSSVFVTAGLTTLGIAAHSLFESVALGSATRFSTSLNIFIAISTHRWATSMALGSRYMGGDLTVATYSVLAILFSAVAPLGVLIGFGAQNLPYIFHGTVFAISAGTFLYIGAFETVAHEFVAHQKYLTGKFLTMVAGAALMVLITGILVITKVH